MDSEFDAGQEYTRFVGSLKLSFRRCKGFDKTNIPFIPIEYKKKKIISSTAYDYWKAQGFFRNIDACVTDAYLNEKV